MSDKGRVDATVPVAVSKAREWYDSEPGQAAASVVSELKNLLDQKHREVARLRAALEAIANNTYTHDDRVAWATAVNFGHIRDFARAALNGES